MENEEGDADAPNDIVLNATPSHVDKMVGCRPAMEARATQSTLIESRHARTQTDGWFTRGIIPIPVPIYVPQPCFVPTPYPSPVPFVLPIVVPIIMAVNNLLGRFTRSKQTDENIDTSVGRIQDVTATNNIFAPPLRSTSSASKASARPGSSFNQSLDYESCNGDQSTLQRHIETSTPIGSIAGEFLCDIDPVPVFSDTDSVGESRRLKPDAFLEPDDLKVEGEANVDCNSLRPTANLGIGMRIKRSFSVVESEDMDLANDCIAAKKPKDCLPMTTIPRDGEI